MVAIHPSIPTKFSALQYSGVEFDTKPCSVRLDGSLMKGWMWPPVEAETIYRQAPRAKGGREPGPEWAGPVGPGRPAQAHLGPIRPWFAPRLLLA
jgi:hypothetical protein